MIGFQAAESVAPEAAGFGPPVIPYRVSLYGSEEVIHRVAELQELFPTGLFFLKTRIISGRPPITSVNC